MSERPYDKIDAEIDLKWLDIPFEQRRELIEGSFGLCAKLTGRTKKLKAGIEMCQSYRRSGNEAYEWIYHGVNGPFL